MVLGRERRLPPVHRLARPLGDGRAQGRRCRTPNTAEQDRTRTREHNSSRGTRAGRAQPEAGNAAEDAGNLKDKKKDSSDRRDESRASTRSQVWVGGSTGALARSKMRAVGRSEWFPSRSHHFRRLPVFNVMYPHSTPHITLTLVAGGDPNSQSSFTAEARDERGEGGGRLN